MFKLLFVAVLSLTFSTLVFAQNTVDSSTTEIRSIMSKFIELNNKQSLQSDEAKKLFLGEAAKWDNSWFGPISNPPDKIVLVEKDFSVARVQTTNKLSRFIDLYFYLKFDSNWKIRSMRALAQTGFIETVYEDLKNKTDLTPDEKQTLANIELTLASDKILTEWFPKNRLQLAKLTQTAIIETKKPPQKVKPPSKPRVTKGGIVEIEAKPLREETDPNEPRTVEFVRADDKKFVKTAQLLKNLHFGLLEVLENKNIKITIGGMTDNTVGFIYSPTEQPPVIDGWRYIWVEKIASNWYLFRTT